MSHQSHVRTVDELRGPAGRLEALLNTGIDDPAVHRAHCPSAPALRRHHAYQGRLPRHEDVQLLRTAGACASIFAEPASAKASTTKAEAKWTTYAPPSPGWKPSSANRSCSPASPSAPTSPCAPAAATRASKPSSAWACPSAPAAPATTPTASSTAAHPAQVLYLRRSGPVLPARGPRPDPAHRLPALEQLHHPGSRALLPGRPRQSRAQARPDANHPQRLAHANLRSCSSHLAAHRSLRQPLAHGRIANLRHLLKCNMPGLRDNLQLGSQPQRPTAHRTAAATRPVAIAPD